MSTLLLVTPAVSTELYTEVEDIYSKNIDLSNVKPVTSEKWAARVFDHIKRDRSVCWPVGFNKLTVKIGHHFPKISGLAVGKLFKR